MAPEQHPRPGECAGQRSDSVSPGGQFTITGGDHPGNLLLTCWGMGRRGPGQEVWQDCRWPERGITAPEPDARMTQEIDLFLTGLPGIELTEAAIPPWALVGPW